MSAHRIPGSREIVARSALRRVGVLLAVLAVVVLAAAASNGSRGPEPSLASGGADVRLLFAGGQSGRLEPCGCTSPQRGGLLALAWAMERLAPARAEGGDSAPRLVQLGPALERSDRRLDGLEAAALATSWRVLDVASVHAAAPELAWMARSSRAGGTAEPSLDLDPWTRVRHPANVRPLDPHLSSSPSTDGDAPPSTTAWWTAAPGVRVAHLIGERAAARLLAAGAIEASMPPARAARALIEDAPDGLWILGVHGTDEEVDDVRSVGVGRSVVVVHVGAPVTRVEPTGAERSADGALDLGALPAASGAPHSGRRAPLLRLARRGVDALDLDVRRVPGGFRVHARVEPLVPPPVGRGGDLVRAVRRALEEHHRAVAAADLLADIPRLPGRAAVDASSPADYVGSARCAACHADHATDWHATSHAHALETLARRGRSWDPECVVCHATGFERTAGGEFVAASGGFRDPRSTPDRGGVGCESCHGPGGDHARSPDASSSATRGGFRARPSPSVCLDCHDPDNSPGFARDAYLPRVDHRRMRDAAPTPR